MTHQEVSFPTRTRPSRPPASPEDLFGSLPKIPTRAPVLWAHQADQLRTYFKVHKNDTDVALELPTGSGKTLVGLLISEWRRRALSHRTLFACPTQQLAEQVHASAEAQGLNTVLLIGSNTAWAGGDLNAYTRCQATAITTYSHIFNEYSKFSDAQSIIFDDAHAAEGYVAEAWALRIPKKIDAYQQIFDALSDDLDPLMIERLTNKNANEEFEPEVRMLPLSIIAKNKSSLAQVLSQAITQDGNLKWAVRRVVPHLSSCLFFVDNSQWYIRPMIPPTFDHHPFVDPVQRIYLSATIGGGGELERAFGRPKIEKIGVPEAWEKAGSGRRFFVFPSLAESAQLPGALPEDHESLTKQILDLANKRLVLSQDTETTEAIATALNIPEDEIFRVKDRQFKKFAESTAGTLLAANRYDGMDLADDTCRMMLIHGLPGTSHLQDRFFETKLRARSVLQERIRTRVVQGLGRCTRGPKDYSVVVVQDEALVRFLSRDENIESMPRELQAEIRFGLHTSDSVTETILLALTKSALNQDAKWAKQAEPQIIEWREDSEVRQYAESGTLASSSRKEVMAWREAWAEQWEAAGQLAMEVHAGLNGTELTPYRSLWAYLAHSWLALAAAEGAETGLKAQEYLDYAHNSSFGTTWLKEIQRNKTTIPTLDAWDDEAVGAVHAFAASGIRSTKLQTQLTQMIADLGQTAADKYERGLTALGKFLGMRTFKPEGSARADSVWLLPQLWITLEAKSEQLSGGSISATYVRQTNTQLDMVANDEELENYPEGSFSVIISPKMAVKPDAVPAANRNVYLVSPDTIMQIAKETKQVWSSIRSLATDCDDTGQRNEIAKTLWGSKLLPEQVKERLTREPVK
ncbi:DEAD/DEAH box helicase [Zhihengliuella halotolerans]|uniref:Type III restriction/modification enzyme restriction subunit n=1 Tax=Zhihengliuella halotolerans TaxID=370736 RepID=A0A4Q8AF43_9MICC|nr:DEAD/DEAH box helicase [Zhihengliuella halotolerans]RZU62229.1 type III restriction/modification enzyme restriction subunit [Zhihengliuella halotolerans]